MAPIWKTARVFISSTFRDMHAERDHLVSVVFPKLRERLERYRIYLDDIDLRWGVTQEQAESGHALDICLHAIDECRPFFIGILGERYGVEGIDLPDDTLARYDWVRDHPGCSVTEFEITYAALRGSAINARAFFYFRDPAALSDVPQSLRRKAYTGADPDQARRLIELKDRIRKSGHPVFDGYPAKWDPDAYDRATKTRGRLVGLSLFGDSVHDQLWEAIRTEFALPDEPPEAVADHFAEEREGHERFMESQVRVYVVREMLHEALLSFAQGDDSCACLLGGPSGSGKSAALAWFVLDFRRRFPQSPVIAHFVGATARSTGLKEILERLCRELYENILREQKELRLIQPAAEADMALPRQTAIEEDYVIPDDASALSSTLCRFLLKIPAQRPVLIVLDALDQVRTDNLNEVLDWLPDPIPKQVRLVVSMKGDGELADPGVLGLCACRVLHADSLSETEKNEIIHKLPSLSAKTLDERQIQLLLNNPACANPLFLRVAIEELRGYGSFELLTQRILAFPGRAPGLFGKVFGKIGAGLKTQAAPEPATALFNQVLARLEEEFDADVVRVALTYLAVARYGLLERELKELVSNLSGAGDLFAVLRQLRPYLLNREGLLTFYHDNLRIAVISRYIDSNAQQQGAHGRLADYFAGQPFYLPNRVANARKADELPWQLFQAARRGDLESLLVTLQFCESKAEAGLVKDLADDFTMANRPLPGDLPEYGRVSAQNLAQQTSKPNRLFRMSLVLPLLEEALRRDLAFLSRHPTALFQCLWNSCWWYDSEEAANHYEQPQEGWEPDRPAWGLGNLAFFLKEWRAEKERNNPGFMWVRSLRPLPQRLGMAKRTIFHGAPVAAVACSADGKWLATAGGYSVKVWNLKTGERRYSFKVGRPAPEVKEVFRKIFENDAESQRELSALRERIRVSEETARCVAWSPDASCLVTGAGLTFYVFKLDDGGMKLRFSLASGGGSNIGPCVAFSADGKRMVLASAGSPCAQVVDADTGKTIFQLSGHSSVSRVSYSPDGSRIVTLGIEPEEEPTEQNLPPRLQHSARIWDASTGQELGHMFGAEFADYSRDGRRWIVATYAEVVVFDALTGNEIVRHRDFSVPIEGDQAEVQFGDETSAFTLAESCLETMNISPDGSRFALADRKGNVSVWDADVGVLLASHNVGPGKASAIAFLPTTFEGLSVEGLRQATNTEKLMVLFREVTRPRLVCGFQDKTARIWDADNAAYAPKLRRAEGNIRGLAFSPDGEVLASAAHDLRLWDALTGRELRRLDGRAFLAFDPQGQRIASLFWQRAPKVTELRIWDVHDGKLLTSLSGEVEASNCAAFSPDGLRLVTAGENVQVWDLQSGKETLCIHAHANEVLSVAFSPDGCSIASGGDYDDRTIKLWDAVTGVAKSEFPVSENGIYVRDLAFSPNGRYLNFSSGMGWSIIDAQTGQFASKTLPLVVDTAALAAYPPIPWGAVRPIEECDTVVCSALNGDKVAWFPVALERIATHQQGRIFAGAVGSDIYLFSLEGESA